MGNEDTSDQQDKFYVKYRKSLNTQSKVIEDKYFSFRDGENKEIEVTSFQDLDSIDKKNYSKTSQDDTVDLNKEAENLFQHFKENHVEGKLQFDFTKLEPIVIKGKRYCILCAELDPPKMTPIGRKRYFCEEHYETYVSWRGEKEKHRLQFKRRHGHLRKEKLGTVHIGVHPHRKKIGVNPDGSNIYVYDFKREAKTVRNELNRTFGNREKKWTKKEILRLYVKWWTKSRHQIALDSEFAYSDNYSMIYVFVRGKTEISDENGYAESIGYWEYYHGDDEERVTLETFFAQDQPKPGIRSLKEIYKEWDYWNWISVLLQINESATLLYEEE
jgi:hypothetical protein